MGKLSAQKIGERIESLRETKGGLCTAEDVLADARRRQSPLHKCFEWDDSKAAELYRIERAGHLLRAVAVFREEAQESPPMRAFHLVRRDDAEVGYTSLDIAMHDPAMRNQILARARTELMLFQKKYEALRELAGVCAAIESYLAREQVAA